jgi:hypothetical protein
MRHTSVSDVTGRNAANNYEQEHLKRHQWRERDLFYTLPGVTAKWPFIFSHCGIVRCHHDLKLDVNRLNCTWLPGFVGFILQSSVQTLDAERYAVRCFQPEQENSALVLKLSWCAGRKRQVSSTAAIP